MTLKLELVTLLQELTASNWERRKRRLEPIPPEVAARAMVKLMKGQRLSVAEYIGANLGFLPGERERIEHAKNEARRTFSGGENSKDVA
jgi:hypothetical protein